MPRRANFHHLESADGRRSFDWPKPGARGRKPRPALTVVLEGGWTVRYDLEIAGGAVAVRELHLEPTKGVATDGLNKGVLSGLPIAEHLEWLHQTVRRNKNAMPPDAWAFFFGETTLSKALRSPRVVRRPGRRGRPDTELAKIAALYVDICRARGPRARGHRSPVTQELSERIHLTRRAAEDVLRQAARRGLLARAPQGKAGGTLTPTAVALLAEQNGSKRIRDKGGK